MWIRVGQDPAFPSPPPHRYRLEYFLRDPGGTVVATDSSSAGSTVSQALVQIGNARLLQSTGTYTLEVRAYIDPNNQTVIPPGDLNFKYKVEVIIVPLQDPVRAEQHHRRRQGQGLTRPRAERAGLLGHHHRPDQLRARPGLLPGAPGGGDGRAHAPALHRDPVHCTGAVPAGADQEGPAAHRDHRGAGGRAERLRRGGRRGVHHQRGPGQLQLPHRHQALSGPDAAVPPVGAVRELRPLAQVPEPGQLRGGAPGSSQRGEHRLLLQVRGRREQLGGRHRLHHHRQVAGRARRRGGGAGSAAAGHHGVGRGQPRR